MAIRRLTMARVCRSFLVSLVVVAVAAVGASQTMATTAVTAAATYYVSPSGSDDASGSIDDPWRTLGYAGGRLLPGDVLYVRGGIYQEKVRFDGSGTVDLPISIRAYPGERPIIDGADYTLPAPTERYSQLVTFSGSHVEAAGLEVRNSLWAGIVISGTDVTLSGVTSHDNMEAGILTWGSTDAVVQDSVAYDNAKSHEDGVHKFGRTSYSTGISAGRGSRGSTLRRNTIYHNWGEGLSTFNAVDTVLEDNTVYDNSKGMYISDTTGTTAQRNLVYCTPGNPYRLSRTVKQHGINLQDEDQRPASSNVTIINNFVAGCVTSFKWYPFNANSAMRNILVANNTFVNATGGASEAAFVIAAPRGISHAESRFVNNVIVQQGGQEIGSLGAPAAGISFTNNLWSKSPGPAMLGTGSVIGDPLLGKAGTPHHRPGRQQGHRLLRVADGFIAFTNNVWSKVPPSSMKGTRSVVGDPRLARAGRLAPGALTGSFFKLPPDSPAINAAADLSEVPVTTSARPGPRVRPRTRALTSTWGSADTSSLGPSPTLAP